MTTEDEPRLALRPDINGHLDDVVVNRVSTFRAERLHRKRIWLCCYLPGTGVDDDRITFEVFTRNGRIEFEVVEHPAGDVSLEETEVESDSQTL